MRCRPIWFALFVLCGGCGAKGCGGGPGPTQSCPYVYLWQGDHYAYYTDLAGSVLGAGIDLFQPEHYAGGIYELGDFAAEGGAYRLKARETIFEADYFDKARLLVVDVPRGHGVLNQWSFTSQLGYRSPVDFMTIKDPRPPMSAVDQQGNDVLAAVSHADEVPLPVTRDQLSRVVVDFGPVARPEQAKLVITAWSHYADLAEQRPPFSAGTVIETRDDSGEWIVRKVAGKNAGDRRTWVIDIGGIVRRDDSRMRITLAHQPIGIDLLDRILLDDSAPVEITVTRVDPSVADLRFGGADSYVPSTLTNRIHADDTRNPLIEGAMMKGRYTRYGDVRQLLREADDRFVIMAHGDELQLEFEEPPRKPESARYVFLDADVFYSIKHSVWGPLTDSIEPLPFHGMKRYPYPEAQWKYRGDADYARYLATWNTRVID